MAIPNYVYPQLTIAQVLARTAAASVSRINPIAIGAQYLLNRFGRETIPTEVFLKAGQVLNWKTKVDGVDTALSADYVVDPDSVALYGVGLEAELADFATGDTNKFCVLSNAASNVIKLSSSVVSGTGLNAAFQGRNVSVGDTVLVNDGVTTRRRTVVGLLGALGSASYGSDSAASNGKAGNNVYNPTTAAAAAASVVSSPSTWSNIVINQTGFNATVKGSRLGSLYGEQFTLVVTTAGAPGVAKVDISSASGLWSAAGVLSVDSSGSYRFNTNLAGATVTFSASTLALGEVLTFNVYGGYARLSDTTQVIASGTYTGLADTTYMIEVTTGSTGSTGSAFTGAVLRVTDTTGLDTPSTPTVTDNVAFNVGTLGLQLKFTSATLPAQAGLRAGDIYYISAKAAAVSTSVFDKVVLDGPAADLGLVTAGDAGTPLAVNFRLPFTGQIAETQAADASAYTVSSTGITVDANLAVLVPERTASQWATFADSVGSIAASYRALVPVPANESWLTLDSASDITAKLGPVDPDNELAYGASWMFSGAQGQRVYVLRVSGTDETAFAAALKKIEATDMVYALGIITDSEDVKQLGARHVADQSARTVKNFRRCYVGTDSPGSYPVLQRKADSTNFTATITTNGVANVLVNVAGANLTIRDIVAGDRVLLPGLSLEFVVKRVITDTELELVSGPVSPITPAVAIEVWKADTAESQATFVRNVSKSLGSRRAVNVWVENGTNFGDSGYQVIPNKFVACEIAGLRCAVLPQQGLTHTEIKSITGAPAMYSRYSVDLLNEIAADGVFIITQDAESGAVYIRHQLTTDPNNGSLYYEDSVGVNLDNISFEIKDLLTGYIGKKNATARTVEEIRNRATNILNSYTSPNVSEVDIGPALVSWQDLVVEIDPVLRDRINLSAALTMPLPLNNIDVVLQANVTV